MKCVWRRVERLLEIVGAQRARVTALGADCAVGWEIASHAAELEGEARALAADSGCDQHARIAP